MSVQQPGVLSTGGVALPPTPAQLQTAFENGVWYALCLWPALHVAVSNSWGGPDSADKRDWFAGAVSDLFGTHPATDQEDLEAFLLQVMQDEFECNVEDETEVAVARDIFRLRLCLKGELVEDGQQVEERMHVARELEARWRNRGQMKTNVQVIDNGPQEEVGDDEDWEDEEGVEMGEAPALVPARQPREKEEPEVDDDGFTMVKGKRRTG